MKKFKAIVTRKNESSVVYAIKAEDKLRATRALASHYREHYKATGVVRIDITEIGLFEAVLVPDHVLPVIAPYTKNPSLLASLKELSEWMREHTGPSDGTHDMLCRAVEAISEVEGN